MSTRGTIALVLVVAGATVGCRQANSPSEACRQQNAFKRAGRSMAPNPTLDLVEELRCDEMAREERREQREDARAAQARPVAPPAPSSPVARAARSSTDSTAAPEPVNLNGLWLGRYGAERFETVRIEQDGLVVVATKITGDTNVPAGKPTFKLTIAGRDSEALIHVADEGYENPRWVFGRLMILSNDTIDLRTGGARPVRLTRIKQ